MEFAAQQFSTPYPGWIQEEYAYLSLKRRYGVFNPEEERRIRHSLQLPEFVGWNFEEWLSDLEDTFEFFQLDEERSFEAAVLSLGDGARGWFEVKHQLRPFSGWQELKAVVARLVGYPLSGMGGAASYDAGGGSRGGPGIFASGGQVEYKYAQKNKVKEKSEGEKKGDEREFGEEKVKEKNKEGGEAEHGEVEVGNGGSGSAGEGRSEGPVAYNSSGEGPGTVGTGAGEGGGGGDNGEGRVVGCGSGGGPGVSAAAPLIGDECGGSKDGGDVTAVSCGSGEGLDFDVDVLVNGGSIGVSRRGTNGRDNNMEMEGYITWQKDLECVRRAKYNLTEETSLQKKLHLGGLMDDLQSLGPASFKPISWERFTWSIINYPLYTNPISSTPPIQLLKFADILRPISKATTTAHIEKFKYFLVLSMTQPNPLHTHYTFCSPLSSYFEPNPPPYLPPSYDLISTHYQGRNSSATFYPP